MASGTAAAVALAGCNEDEESDSPAQGGETETQGAPQEPANGSTRGSGTRTEGATQRAGAEDDGGGTDGGDGDAGGATQAGDGETPEGDGESPEEDG